MTFRRAALPLFVPVLLALAAQPAMAEKMKPGLWVINTKMSGGKMQDAMAMTQERMAMMSPQQRAQMEAAMAKQNVVLNKDGFGHKVCVTPEMAARQQLPMQQGSKGNCKFEQGPTVGNTMKYSYSCTTPQTRGEGTAVFSSPTAYTATVRVTTAMAGTTDTSNMDSSAHWLATDCGDIKPVLAPAH